MYANAIYKVLGSIHTRTVLDGGPMELERNTIPAKAHIENRGLFSMVSGELKLQEWEHAHLHVCEVCQEILSGLLSQQTGFEARKHRTASGNAA